MTDGGTMTSNLQIYGHADERTVVQMDRCLEAEEGSRGVLCADNHLGYSQPIGGAVAYRDHISPSGVGYDIGCGNKAVRTGLIAADVEIPGVMDEIVRRVSFGIGRANNEPADHAVLDAIREAPFAPQRALYDLAAKQLGTVGAGNHYVDLFTDDQGWLWVGVHFGSRGFGHKTASGFLALAAGLSFTGHAPEGEMDSPPIVLPIDSDLGQSYIEAMTLAGEYAYAGRDVVVDTVLDILGTQATYEVHNHHNYAWRETHDGTDWWVVRKGCTPAYPGQAGFVGATMGEDSVILEGTESGADAMFSTVHGAGRAMSRTQAAGKQGTVMFCTERDCGFWVKRGQYIHERDVVRKVPQHERFTLCPDHPGGRMRKGRRRVKAGLIDFPIVQADLRAKGIELRGGAADEAPGAYKRLPEVLAAHGDTIRVTHRLHPIGVAMADPNTFDPFKD